MLSLQYKPFGHSIMFLWINEHLQDALLTKLPGQFIELHKSQFFPRLENLIWDSIAHFSYSILRNWELTSPLKAFIICYYMEEECGLKKRTVFKS